jgi:ABC-type lipoprotein export system ATPase subunit/putative methionine-R-sulfoxide reductase with GAF domain
MDKNELLLNTATLRIAESILLTENIEEALSTTLNIVVDILKSEAGAIWLLDKDTNMLHAITSCGPVDLTNVSMDNGIGVEGTSVKEEKSVFISDVEGVENADGCVFDVHGIKTRSLICVPLNDLENTIGCMCIVNRLDGNLYSENDLKVCERSASLTAMVISEKELAIKKPEEKEVLIELHNVIKEFPSGEEVIRILNNINLKIYKNEFVVVLGESGCGKTTMMNIIGGMDQVTSGTLIVDGEDYTSRNEDDMTEYRRSFVGYIFQAYHLMPNLTARENVRLISEISPDPIDIDEALDMVGLSERANYYPAQLSGGQQQRVSIARAIARNPKIILADEPTAALDFKTGQEVLRVIEKVVKTRDTTVMMVTHNVEIAKMADRVISLRNGRIASIKYNGRPLHADDLIW